MPDRTESREYNKRYHAEHRESENAKSRAWQKENRKLRSEYMRRWRATAIQKHPEKYANLARERSLKHRYGITTEEYSAMLARQGGHCALCDRTPASERHGRLNVDHCHDTGRIRGLLCTVHNSALAAFGDNEDGLIRAVAYIKGGV